VPMGTDSQVPFAHRLERRHLLDVVWVEVLELKLVLEEDSMNEPPSGDRGHPATRRHPRPSIMTQLQCVLMDSDVRRDVPATKHCTTFFFPLVPLPL
jgi:hypothetical protein